MKNWLCEYCKKVVQSEREPNNSSNSCHVGLNNSKWHAWRNLGESGHDIYECPKCNITIYSKGQPRNGNSCIDRHFHEWHLLQKAPEKRFDQAEDTTTIRKGREKENGI